MGFTRRPISLTLFLLGVLACIWIFYPLAKDTEDNFNLLTKAKTIHTDFMNKAKTYFSFGEDVRTFTNKVDNFTKFQHLCYKDAGPMTVSDLIKYSEKLQNGDPFCDSAYNMFRSIYFIYTRYATIKVSKSFMVKLKGWFPGRPDLIAQTKNQTLIFINNLQTDEAVVFNTVRANRPVASTVEGDLY